MLSPTDFDHLLTLARAYPAVQWRDEIVQEAAVRVLEGMEVHSAFQAAVRHADTLRRYERNQASLDEVMECAGDIDVQTIEPRPLSRQQRYADTRKAGQNATRRVAPCGMDELPLADTVFLRTVIRNLIDRQVIGCNPDTMAIDVTMLSEELRESVVRVLCAYTKAEIGKHEAERAEAWLTRYAGLRSDFL